MRKRGIILIAVLLVFSTLGFGYINADMPSVNSVTQGIEALQEYSYVQTVEFDNYQFIPTKDGGIREVFLYHGRLVERGHVDLTTMSLEQTQEFYVNGTLVSGGYIQIQNEKVVRGYKEEGGKRIALTEENAAQITGYSFEKLPEELLKLEPLKVVRGIKTIVPKQDSTFDRMLVGLGLKEEKFEYEITTKEGQRWIVQVDGNGIPVRLENIPRDKKHPKVTVIIEAQGVISAD